MSHQILPTIFIKRIKNVKLFAKNRQETYNLSYNKMREKLSKKNERRKDVAVKIRLTDVETKELVFQAQQGDKEKLTELYNAFEDFRLNLAKSFYGKGVDWEDIQQEVDKNFMLSVYGYDPNKSDSAILHIVSRTKRTTLNYYNTELEYKNNVTLKPIIYPEDGLVGTLDVSEEYLDFIDEVSDFSDEEKKVIFYYFVLGYTQEETAREIGISRMKVQRISQKIKKINFFPKK